MNKILMTIAAALLSASPAFGQAAAPDDRFNEISQDRSKYAGVVFFFGDSIMRGYGLGTFPDLATADLRNSPLWPLRSPASMAELMTDNTRIGYAYAGGPVGPDEVSADELADRIEDLHDKGTVGSADVIVLEDAGDRTVTQTEYAAQWKTVIKAAASTGATVLVMNTFDGGPDIAFPKVDWKDFSYSTPVLSDDGELRSYNDAIAQAVAETNLPSVVLVDMDTTLRAYERALLRNFGLPITFEGIHPNVWGYCPYIAAVMRAGRLTDTFGGERLTLLLEDNMEAVSYGSHLRKEDVATAVHYCTNGPVVMVRFAGNPT